MNFDKIKYTASYNKRFYVRLILFQYYKKWHIKFLTIGGLISFIVCLSFLFSWNPIGFSTFPFFGIFYFVLVAILPFYLILKTKRSIKNQSLFNQEISFEIDSNGIKIILTDYEKLILWNQIHKIENHSKVWLIYGTIYSFFYLPKDSLSIEQQNQLMQWIVNSSKFTH